MQVTSTDIIKMRTLGLAAGGLLWIKDEAVPISLEYALLALDIGDDIPEIQAVPELAKSIWCNLVSNALKYTPEDGEISIGLQTRDNALIGWIQDSGIGISAEDQKKIFCEFFRGENAKKKSIAGTGLGLVLVKKIVEGLGGEISFESELGAGSTFQFMIPIGDRSQIAA